MALTSQSYIELKLIFDKAERAGRLEQLRALREKLAAEAKEFEGQLKKAGPAEQSHLKRKIDRRRKRLAAVAGIIETYQDNEDALGKTGHKRSRRKDSDSR